MIWDDISKEVAKIPWSLMNRCIKRGHFAWWHSLAQRCNTCWGGDLKTYEGCCTTSDTAATPVPVPLWVSRHGSERLCTLFVVPCGGEMQVDWSLKYSWRMINSCGWWKSEACPTELCWSWGWYFSVVSRWTPHVELDAFVLSLTHTRMSS